jgi:hypothetical protein
MSRRAYLATTLKSSKYVTESALVHSPILPAPMKVSSVASIFGAVVVTRILFPFDAIRAIRPA